ncbi:MAG: radical SAM protein [Calditrichaeota bacterium]|nr:MAG: radical SAM protein [Calditrichota bacterium]
MAGGVLVSEDLSRQAFRLRKQVFGDEISFYAPGLKRFSTEEFQQKRPRAFLPISLTGSACVLQCDHCAAKILDPMIPLRPVEGLFHLCKRLADSGTEGVLISGGSGISGAVPLQKHVEDLARVKRELGLRVLVHCGLVSERTCADLRRAGVDGVMIDIIGADETIREVYHLDATVEDFDRSLELLHKYGHSVRPHIIMGLHYGRFLGEDVALEMIANYPVHALVLVVLTPMVGTRMQNVPPPEVPVLEAFIRKARLRVPETLLMLGCARPPGRHKEALDKVAVDNGINGIAYPAEGIVSYARSRGLKPSFFENACSCGC